jgi:hypothetical protein
VAACHPRKHRLYNFGDPPNIERMARENSHHALDDTITYHCGLPLVNNDYGHMKPAHPVLVFVRDGDRVDVVTNKDVVCMFNLGGQAPSTIRRENCGT